MVHITFHIAFFPTVINVTDTCRHSNKQNGNRTNKPDRFIPRRSEEDNLLEPSLSDVTLKEVDDNRMEEIEQQTPKKNSKEDEDFINKLNTLINENMAGGELSIKFLTDNMAMNRASLYNKVKLLTGLGVNDYINRLRIERSVFLLTNTNMNINEISYEVGFSYPRYFSTSFKQVKGMTPTRFKEENRKGE